MLESDKSRTCAHNKQRRLTSVILTVEIWMHGGHTVRAQPFDLCVALRILTLIITENFPIPLSMLYQTPTEGQGMREKLYKWINRQTQTLDPAQLCFK